MATVGGSSTSTSRSSGGGTAKSTAADQISQSIQSTCNLLHLMQLSSPSHIHLSKLPKNLMAKMETIKNTGQVCLRHLENCLTFSLPIFRQLCGIVQVLQQLPVVISSLDAYMENGLNSIPHLKTVSQLLSNMENVQLKSSSQSHLSQECQHEVATRPLEKTS